MNFQIRCFLAFTLLFKKPCPRISNDFPQFDMYTMYGTLNCVNVNCGNSGKPSFKCDTPVYIIIFQYQVQRV